MRIFVSSENVDRPPANALIARLRQEGWYVDHSPRNPAEGQDSRWPNWYREGLPAALDQTDIFIIALNHVWDSSSWMAEEAFCAMAQPNRQPVPHVFYWNPSGVEVTVQGVKPYLRERLPNALEAVVDRLRAIGPT
jgi:hypothetical protein